MSKGRNKSKSLDLKMKMLPRKQSSVSNMNRKTFEHPRLAVLWNKNTLTLLKMSCFGFHCMEKSRHPVEINNKDECSILVIQNLDIEQICNKFQCIFILEYNHLQETKQEVCDNISCSHHLQRNCKGKNNFTDITST